jgi:hypothetical protein
LRRLRRVCLHRRVVVHWRLIAYRRRFSIVIPVLASELRLFAWLASRPPALSHPALEI